MLQAIRHTFFKIRVFFGAVRAGVMGFALVLLSWIVAAPPSPTELAAMALPSGTPANDPLLRVHRMAKIVVAINSDSLYAYVADQSDTGMSATQLRDNIELAADGYGELSTMLQGTPETARTQKPFVGSGGAKFVTARTN